MLENKAAGRLKNTGDLKNWGTLANRNGGTLTNETSGTLTNYDTLTSHGAIKNNGTGALLEIDTGGVLTNTGALNIWDTLANRIHRARNSQKPRRNVAGQAKGD